MDVVAFFGTFWKLSGSADQMFVPILVYQYEIQLSSTAALVRFSFQSRKTRKDCFVRRLTSCLINLYNFQRNKKANQSVRNN